MAGSSDEKYRLAVIDGMGYGKGFPVEFDRVTTTLSPLKGGGGFAWWGYKLGLEAALDLQLNGHDITQHGTDVEELYALCKELKRITPHGVRDSAARRGSDVHDIAEFLLLNNELPDEADISDSAKPFVAGLVKWKEETLTPAYSNFIIEQPVFSLTHRVCGTLDAMFKVEGLPLGDVVPIDPNVPTHHFELYDFKTSKSMQDSHEIQTAAYVGFCVEMGLVPAFESVKRFVVLLRNDGTYKVERCGFDFDSYLTVLKLHREIERWKG